MKNVFAYKKMLRGDRKNRSFYDSVFEELMEETARIHNVKVTTVRLVITSTYRQIAASMKNPEINHIYIRFLGTFKRFKHLKKNGKETKK